MKRADNRLTLPDGTRVPKVKNLMLRAGRPCWYIRVNGKLRPTDVPLVGKSQIETQGNWKRAQHLLRADVEAAPTREKGIELIDGDVPTLGLYAPIYTKRYMADHAGREREASILAKFVTAFGAQPLKAITDTMVIDWRNERRQAYVPRTTRHVTASTVNREVDVLKQVLVAAVKDRHLKASPLVGLAQLAKVNRPKVALNLGQLIALFERGFTRPADRALAELALHSFGRLGNVLNVQWRDFKNTDGEELVELHLDNTKNGRPHAANIPREIYDGIVRDCPRVKGQPYVFWHRRLAKNPTHWRSIVRKMFAAACARVGIPYGREHRNDDGEHVPGVTWHRLRSSAASLWLARGASLQQVKDAGNWKSMGAMEQHYLTTFSADQRAMARAVFQSLATKSTHESTQSSKPS